MNIELEFIVIQVSNLSLVSLDAQHWWCGLKAPPQLGHFASFTSVWFEKFPLLWNLRMLVVYFSAQFSQSSSIARISISLPASLSISLPFSQSSMHYGLSPIEKGKLRILQNEYLGPHVQLSILKYLGETIWLVSLSFIYVVGTRWMATRGEHFEMKLLVILAVAAPNLIW